MKKTTCIVALLVALIGTTNVFAQKAEQPNPLEFLKRVIPRGLPFESWKDLDNCLISTFWKDKVNADIVYKEIADSVLKKGVLCKHEFRDTVMSFFFVKDSFIMTYNLWFKLNNGVSDDIQYQLGSYNSINDLWMSKCMVSYEKSKVDPMDDFTQHVKVVAQMMKMDLWIPHKITSTLSYDLMYGGSKYTQRFIDVMNQNHLTVSFSEERKKMKFMTVNNSYRSYVIVDSGIFEPTFEVIPRWQ